MTGPIKSYALFYKSKDDILHLHARGQVNEDPAALLHVYEEAGQVPDIWNLTEWSDWLLPAYMERAGQRFRGIKGIVSRDHICC